VADLPDRAVQPHEAEYVDDGGDGYLACRCGYGHILGDDALVDHIHDARLAGVAQERPSIDAERWMADAANELQRLVLIIEGTGDARLQAPHGQTSNRPRALLEQYARLSSPEPVEPGE
jgi:hypothetical protein